MSLETLQARIDYRFKDVARLRQALTHRSFGQPNNERLEFLGDSVVNHVVALALFSRFPELREGDLSRLRAQLVCQDALHGLAVELQLGAVLRLGEGELKSRGAERPSILSDALEAVFAAVYLDGGFDAAKAVIDRLFADHLTHLDPKSSLKDPKTRLQEWLQARRRQLPKYRLVETRGEAHAQEFEVECTIDGGMQTRGTGSSRRAAEQQAASAAMEKLEQHAG
ncbi:ribonuclease III [Denitromonas iodatirespirans]|uniref:Ribonuclease 3 n=1 Tax=Denitromonas iodatirespirans TaxID=2795389 RepID=A0A944DEL7_DENI1|nr:ribonuclease III [Denitromonas iodatirespirans]MBT0961398.1 ribonuclease III [Denitromonas iodatirespirans]